MTTDVTTTDMTTMMTTTTAMMMKTRVSQETLTPKMSGK